MYKYEYVFSPLLTWYTPVCFVYGAHAPQTSSTMTEAHTPDKCALKHIIFLYIMVHIIRIFQNIIYVFLQNCKCFQGDLKVSVCCVH